MGEGKKKTLGLDGIENLSTGPFGIPWKLLLFIH